MSEDVRLEGAYTLREAARICGVSRDTMKRRLAEGVFPNAWRDDAEIGAAWKIPIADLLNAGLRPHQVQPVQDSVTTVRGRALTRDLLLRQLKAVEAELILMTQLATARAEHIQDLHALLESVRSPSTADNELPPR